MKVPSTSGQGARGLICLAGVAKKASTELLARSAAIALRPILVGVCGTVESFSLLYVRQEERKATFGIWKRKTICESILEELDLQYCDV